VAARRDDFGGHHIVVQTLDAANRSSAASLNNRSYADALPNPMTSVLLVKDCAD
jgi:hypothetical protein